MKNWHNWATMVENWKFQDAVMLYIYIYIYIIYIIYIIYQLKSFCWSELQIEVMAKTENLKSYNDYWITEGFDYLEVCVHCYY